MNYLDDLGNIDPILIIISAVAVYILFIFLRRNLGWVILAVWAAICFSLLVLPGGTSTLQEAKTLPNIGAKAACLVSSVTQGAPWGISQGARLTSCRFRGLGVGSIGEGVSTHSRTGEALLSSYGR